MSKPFSDRPMSAQLTRFSGKKCFRHRWQSWILTVSFVAGVIPLVGFSAQAQQNPASTAPDQVKTLLTGIDTAANSQNVRSVAEFFSPNFTHSDGLNRQTLQESLAVLWKRYPKLNYRTELKSWKREGSAIIADTVTYITGVKKEGDREFKLDAQLEARQRVENQKIVSQEVLNERSQITSGSNPPTLKINLPEQVRGGQEFTFDAVVQEPLGDDLLMGAALEEAIKPEGFLNITTANLEPLPSGGIFKVGRAPNNAEQHWLSAVVVRHDGITMVTQRLRIQGRK
ncbi:MAG: nuclear transport factor 2 family protein [Leptolyngbyaceae cyanobacterium bins.302]|nr:nuclear transport factor 2 family protein [Leptolyngbyaceae cyanobacterium bins.302]